MREQHKKEAALGQAECTPCTQHRSPFLLNSKSRIPNSMRPLGLLSGFLHRHHVVQVLVCTEACTHLACCAPPDTSAATPQSRPHWTPGKHETLKILATCTAIVSTVPLAWDACAMLLALPHWHWLHELKAPPRAVIAPRSSHHAARRAQHCNKQGTRDPAEEGGWGLAVMGTLRMMVAMKSLELKLSRSSCARAGVMTCSASCDAPAAPAACEHAQAKPVCRCMYQTECKALYLKHGSVQAIWCGPSMKSDSSFPH